jgi:hypothetical protein
VSSNQMRICDCWLDVGGCFCKFKKQNDEGKRVNKDEEQDRDARKIADDDLDGPKKNPNPLGWDARNITTNVWIRQSDKEAEG